MREFFDAPGARPKSRHPQVFTVYYVYKYCRYNGGFLKWRYPKMDGLYIMEKQ
jgi:hypothetical protein